MHTDTLLKQFDAKKEFFNLVEKKSKYLLSNGLANVDIHSLESRIKEFDSFKDKIRRKGIKNPFEEIHDIVALRVVCYFLDDINRIKEIIRKIFEVIKEDDIVRDHEPHEFGYLGVQSKVRFKNDLHLNNAEKNITFEIQVRTIAQDAWASISHRLDYKREHGIPEPLKRDFFALSGLFYVADTHFKILKDEQTKKFFSSLNSSA